MKRIKSSSFTEIPYEDDLLSQIQDKESMIRELESQLAKSKFELQELKRQNAEVTTIHWKDSIRWCLEVDASNPLYFIKTPAFVAKCIAQKHGVEITRDIKNKISTTLSIMFNAKEIGRIQHQSKTFYGLSKFFEGENLDELKAEYKDKIDKLRQ